MSAQTTAVVKERPILFHARSIKGILEGRKSQTRRIVKVPRWIDASPGPYDDIEECSCEAAPYPHLAGIGDVSGCMVCIHCPYGQPGERLWVRETWATGWNEGKHGGPFKEYPVVYRADELMHDADYQWKPSIHMPRKHSRLTLEITDIRVERVQDISWQDAFAEGIVPQMCCNGFECGCRALPVNDPLLEFPGLWDDTNGKGAWDRNDWVWCVSFKRIL